MRQLKIPKIWRRALILALPKPDKPLGDPKSYRPLLYLCCVSRLKSSRDSSTLVSNQPSIKCSQRSKRTFDTEGRPLLTRDIEDSFSTKKAGTLFVDLTAAYNNVWHRGLTCKLLQLLPGRHMVHMIMEQVGNRSFTLTTGNGKRNRLGRLKDSVPQGSVLAPLLFNIYISNLPTIVSRKFAYADGLAIMHADGDWQAVEGVLSKDMATIGEYLQTWKLRLNITKVVSAAFHLDNKGS